MHDEPIESEVARLRTLVGQIRMACQDHAGCESECSLVRDVQALLDGSA